ncbi:MAG: DUF4058 family protein [Planctomycetes bacterium]|nr:DUF4058 family protein [Planctomycetota bacterium]
MPSPFPGMDPRLEGYEWESFHAPLLTNLADALVPQVRPRYTVRSVRRVYLEHVPVDLTLPIPEERRETYLVLRERETLEVVTVIEVLSPTNKRHGSDGQKEYMKKREEVLRSASHLVEIDLLRGGERLPTLEPLPAGDYHAFVSRAKRRPRVQVYSWTLKDRLPVVPIPLAGKDPDVQIDLAVVFDSRYERAGYDYSLDPRAPIDPPLSPEEAAWAREILGG